MVISCEKRNVCQYVCHHNLKEYRGLSKRHGNDTAWQGIRYRFVVARSYGVIIKAAFLYNEGIQK